jgi:hypothetical protein
LRARYRAAAAVSPPPIHHPDEARDSEPAETPHAAWPSANANRPKHVATFAPSDHDQLGHNHSGADRAALRRVATRRRCDENASARRTPRPHDRNVAKR